MGARILGVSSHEAVPIAEVDEMRVGEQNIPLFLLLDSGANAPFLWKVEEAMRMRSVAPQNISAGQRAQMEFTILPPQDMRIGDLLVHQISFAIPTGNNAAKIDVDGLLPTAQFRRVYIDYRSRFVVLESW